MSVQCSIVLVALLAAGFLSIIPSRLWDIPRPGRNSYRLAWMSPGRWLSSMLKEMGQAREHSKNGEAGLVFGESDWRSAFWYSVPRGFLLFGAEEGVGGRSSSILKNLRVSPSLWVFPEEYFLQQPPLR